MTSDDKPSGPAASAGEAPLLLALGMALLALLDVALEPKLASPRALASAFGVGLGVGSLLAAVAVLVFRALYRRAWIFSALAWLSVGGGFAVWLVGALAVLEKLTSAHRALAIQSLVIAVVAGLGLTLIGATVQPRHPHTRGWIARQRAILRVPAAAGACVFAGALVWLDRRGALATYPAAETAMRWLCLAVIVFALYALSRPLSARIAEKANQAWLASLVVSVLCVFLVDTATATALMERPYARLALSSLRSWLDMDRDGHSPLLAGGDCDDLDAAVNPSAREVPANGVDDNCALGDAPRAAADATASQAPAASGPSPVSVVLITADALSATHMSLYGYERSTTPNIDAWAREHAVVFEDAITSGSATAIAFSSIFRGVYPRRLAWARVAKTWNGHFVPVADGAAPELAKGDKLNRIYRLPVGDPRRPLPWWLARRGMKTFATTAVHFADPGSGVAGEFDQYVSKSDGGSSDPDDEGATRQALKWLARLSADDRFFLWIHYLGPHTPTTRQRGVKQWGDSVADGYDHEIATFDHRVAPLLEELGARRRRGEPVVVIVSADHGEEIGFDRYHAHVLSEGVGRIPLAISRPGVAPRRSQQLVSSVDLFPTILGLTGTPAPPGLDGIDLGPVLADETRRTSRVVLADAWVSDVSDEVVSNLVMATDGKHRLTRDFRDQTLLAEPSRSAHGGDLHGSPAPSRLQVALDTYVEQTGAYPYYPYAP